MERKQLVISELDGNHLSHVHKIPNNLLATDAGKVTDLSDTLKQVGFRSAAVANSDEIDPFKRCKYDIINESITDLDLDNFENKVSLRKSRGEVCGVLVGSTIHSEEEIFFVDEHVGES